MDLAGYIERAREKKELSYRDLERACALDHAYIWRLANGSKTAPSTETLEKLSDALGFDEREREILQLVAKQPLDDALFNLMIKRTEIPWIEFEQVAMMSSRGNRPTSEVDWMNRIEMIRNF